MTPERWHKIEGLYHAASEQEPEKRAAWLADACLGDPELQAEVEKLLHQAGSLLEHPLWEPLSASLADPAQPVQPGAQLGPYRIEEPLGAGGMGQVFRARDTRLDRPVAIKVLTAEFAGRFDREARAISALNHPNICTLYDVGPNYLVMELVEGPTLAERMKGGAISLSEALEIAWQIAGGLEAAHERGIVHRDLKPANIKISPDGTVKVLDFGLAKANGAAAAQAPDSTQSLTMTRAGTVLGTASYMAPEQARGAAVDKRADIWAFGVVLYEMLTGERLFRGDTVPDTLAAVLSKELDWSRVPPKAERLLRRCLERDPRKRLRDIGDARFLQEDDRREPAAPSRRASLLAIGAATLALVLAVALVFLWTSTRHAAPSMLRLSVDLGEDAAVGPRRGNSMALSPDGSRLVFSILRPGGKSLLAVRRLDQPNAAPLAGTDGGEAPFFSPDGKTLGFLRGWEAEENRHRRRHTRDVERCSQRARRKLGR